MDPHTIAIVSAVVLAAAWLLFDRVIYKGPASVIDNHTMKHYSTSHKTVFVVPHDSKATKSQIFVATVSNAKAAQIAAEGIAARQVTVRQRLFGQPRVTRIA